MQVIICGGRHYEISEEGYGWLASFPITRVLQGGAEGADRCARQWAQQRGIPWDTFPADWAQYGKAAGPRRNATMLQALQSAGDDIAVMAFPGGAGTADMVHKAETAGVPLLSYVLPGDDCEAV